MWRTTEQYHQPAGAFWKLSISMVYRYLLPIHQHMLVVDGRALDFYRRCGFERAGKSEPMWIYAGHDHGPKDAA